MSVYARALARRPAPASTRACRLSHRQHRASRSRPVWTRLSSFLQLETPTHALQFGLPLVGRVIRIYRTASDWRGRGKPLPTFVQPCGGRVETGQTRKLGGGWSGLVWGGHCHTNRELQDQTRLTREAMNEMWNDGGQRHVSEACLYKNVSVKNYDRKAAPH